MSFSLSQKGSKTVKLPHGRTVSVGIHEAQGAVAHKGTKGATVVDIGGYHEFGLGVPRRSFIADWFDQHYNENTKALYHICQAAVKNGGELETGLKRFAAWSVGQVQQRIADGIMPELAESTKKQKARRGTGPKDTPLIDTGQLRASIRGQVA